MYSNYSIISLLCKKPKCYTCLRSKNDACSYPLSQITYKNTLKEVFGFAYYQMQKYELISTKQKNN